jgi:hypothetical protein
LEDNKMLRQAALSARSFAFTEGFGFRRDGMVMLPLLVTNGAGF